MVILGFRNRVDAAMQLTRSLSKYSGRDAVILTPPNGSLVLGNIVSKTLDIPLELMMMAPVHHPQRWDDIIGMVTPDEQVLYPSTEDYGCYCTEVVPAIRKR